MIVHQMGLDRTGAVPTWSALGPSDPDLSPRLEYPPLPWRHAQVVKGTVCKTVIRRFESAWRLHFFFGDSWILVPKNASSMSRTGEMASRNDLVRPGSEPEPLDSADFLVELPTFSGSLGALFLCVKEKKVDLMGIPLAPICEAYFRHLISLSANGENGPDIEGMAGGMAALAYMLEKKAWGLLPRVEPELEAPEEAMEKPEGWVHEFRPAIEALKLLHDERGQLFFRSPETHRPYELPFDMGDVTVNDLASAFERLMARAVPAEPERFDAPRRSISDQMVVVMRELRDEFLPLDELVVGEFTRSEAVWWFLALLELIRLGQARLMLGDGTVVFAKGGAGAAD